MNRVLYLTQRISAMVLAPLVIVHLLLILIVIQGGLSAGEILGRTQGNLLWGFFYSLFVVAAAAHAPIGLRNILREWTGLNPRIIDIICVLLALLLLLTGFRAIVAVV